ncbi:BadF/BadG/BcrA/BcrD ATPase family protein [Pajaroellobacter abortibovis]|uniref:CoA activase n=1 Tax=Pajaroellobacter abortibovis TaxID=1882918 RepID=A0A1L6MWH4_9BACT|nr:BadF/BadG/BcrA/BcrD ATPase family protein [Pajaroellobacter abortibovis]APR99883.1 CoA activase [Pajaroellobacter abortibovis]
MKVAAKELAIGVDVGSTTVKVVVIDPDTKEILWSDYQRHHTKQPEYVLDMLKTIQKAFTNGSSPAFRIFMTGSGAGPLCDPLGGKFVQEVNAVTLAVEHLHPDVGSVIELGGQDAKIIMFKTDEHGQKTALASMNDKCASGTGATIDKCFLKVNALADMVTRLHFDPTKLHHVAAKCGVFAETDIVNLIKSGIPAEEVLCSLADAIVMQNLSVLTRGGTLKHRVLLLGGPNTYLPFLQECWRLRIPQTWQERSYAYPQDIPLEELIFVPQNSQYYAAFGAVMYGLCEERDVGLLCGLERLEEYITHGRKARLGESAGPPLSYSHDALEEFKRLYTIPPFVPAAFTKGEEVCGYLGLDGGSTSSKAVLLDEKGDILVKAYQLSKGNPLQDTKELLAQIRDHVEGKYQAQLNILGFGATGYAADILQETLCTDVNIVETVAHMISAVHFFGDIDVICDIGGQDIKVLFMKNGEIHNFRLSNSCSAGNGMLLQATSDSFGVPVTEYAQTAFQAELSPKFSYGCAVFLDTDRVNFQKEGFSKEELLAGLAHVLPKNVWQYVVQIPRLASLGRRFVLQGGTQYNLAAVKAQVDYIKERVPDAEVYVHPHTGEAGAIGAAKEAMRVVKRRGWSTFVGLDTAIHLAYTTKNDAETVCHFCPNECKRTFIDAKRPDGSVSRYIAGFSCEKGTVESKEAMLALVKEQKKIADQYPNCVDYESKKAFMHFYDPLPLPSAETLIDDIEVRRGLFGIRRIALKRKFCRSSEESARSRKKIRIGIPRALNIYSTAPWFRTYFETIGIAKQHIVFSDHTTEEMWMEGGKYGSIDPCYPSKVVQAHVHSLLFHKHTREKPLHYIFFPVLTHVNNFVVDTMDNASCPIVAGAPNVIKAAFTKEIDFFAQRQIEYLDPALSFEEPTLLARRMFETFGSRLGITEDENDHACQEAWKALDLFEKDLQGKGKAILETVEAEDRVAILMIGRPYHSDPGLNHGIPEQFQALGYPILSVRSIPKDRAFLDRYFKQELLEGEIQSPLELNHVWPENYSVNSAQKVWATYFAAHHPNVVLLDLSSFKCGHDAPTYGLIDSIVSAAKTPYAALHDIDANKPGGSIKIRVKTYVYTLKLYEERLQDLRRRKGELHDAIRAKREELLRMRQEQKKFEQSPDPQRYMQLEALRIKLALYKESLNQREDDASGGIIKLGKKTAWGVVRIQA